MTSTMMMNRVGYEGGGFKRGLVHLSLTLQARVRWKGMRHAARSMRHAARGVNAFRYRWGPDTGHTIQFRHLKNYRSHQATYHSGAILCSL